MFWWDKVYMLERFVDSLFIYGVVVEIFIWFIWFLIVIIMILLVVLIFVILI